MWAVGRYDLRLSEADFWELELSQYVRLCERRRKDLHARELGPARLLYTLVNHWRDPQTPEIPLKDLLDYADPEPVDPAPANDAAYVSHWETLALMLERQKRQINPDGTT